MSESSQSMARVPPELLAAIAVDLRAVRRLAPPAVRALWMVPFALLLVMAAPATFSIRSDYAHLGFALGWGASIAQAAAGLAMIAAGLRESVPGRNWEVAPLAGLLCAPVAGVAALGMVTWMASGSPLLGPYLIIALACGVCSFASALPPVLLGTLLVQRAYPTRPAVAGALVGFGAGLMADAGWRLWCHYAEPSHVLVAHLGGVVAAALLGAVLCARAAHGRT